MFVWFISNFPKYVIDFLCEKQKWWLDGKLLCGEETRNTIRFIFRQEHAVLSSLDIDLCHNLLLTQKFDKVLRKEMAICYCSSLGTNICKLCKPIETLIIISLYNCQRNKLLKRIWSGPSFGIKHGKLNVWGRRLKRRGEEFVSRCRTGFSDSRQREIA